jgi:L-rhamnose mutarotase
MVIGLRPEMEARYRALHADPWRAVLERITRSHLRNYSIYLAELPGGLFLFSYFEYTGEDFGADMAALAADPETRRWWRETDSCQLPLGSTDVTGSHDGAWWTTLQEVFHHP